MIGPSAGLASAQIVILQSMLSGKHPRIEGDRVWIDGWGFKAEYYTDLLERNLITPHHTITDAGITLLKTKKNELRGNG